MARSWVTAAADCPGSAELQQEVSREAGREAGEISGRSQAQAWGEKGQGMEFRHRHGRQAASGSKGLGAGTGMGGKGCVARSRHREIRGGGRHRRQVAGEHGGLASYPLLLFFPPQQWGEMDLRQPATE